MTTLRSIYRSLLLVALLLTACCDGWFRKLFLGLTPGPGGAVWVHHWCRRILRALGIHSTAHGLVPAVGPNGMALVANHLSYLEILVFAAQRPFIMVAKSEVRSWPLIGWITAQAGTVYVQRADCKGGRTQTHAQVNALMATAFQSGLPVLFFPEGTTTDGSHVLPFRRGLFNSVVQGQVSVHTAAIAYSLDHPNPHATIATHVCYWGDMDFVTHLFHCVGLRGLHAHVRFNPAPIQGSDRFALSLNAHTSVEATYAALIPQQQTHVALDHPYTQSARRILTSSK